MFCCLVRLSTGGIELRSLRQCSWDGYSVCSGLFWGKRWWSVGVVAADGVCPCLGCILQSCSGRWLSSYYGFKSFDIFVGQMSWGLLLFPSFFCELICYFISLMPVCTGIHWRTTQVVWARVLMFSVSFFCIVSGSPDMRACRVDSESVSLARILMLLNWFILILIWW